MKKIERGRKVPSFYRKMLRNIIEIELSSLCNAKCSGCMRTILDNQGKYYYKGNLLLDDIIDWFEPLDISNTKIKMCGVLGDPMINPELYEIIFYYFVVVVHL